MKQRPRLLTLRGIRGLLLALLLLTLPAFLHANTPVNIVAWNLEWFPGGSPEATEEEAADHMKAAQKALRDINPDVFIGQEIHDWKAFDELVSAVPGLKTHVVSSFRSTRTREIDRMQIGIASKLVCRGAWWQDFKVIIPRTARGFSFAALEHPTSAELLMVYGLHLKSNRGGDDDAIARWNAAVRNDSTRQLIAALADTAQAFGHAPIAGWIVSGDLNTNHDNQFPHCRVIKMLEDLGFHNTWRGVTKKDRATWRSSPDGVYDPTTFDYFLVNGFGQRIKAELLEVPRELSDHYPFRILIP